MRDYTATGRITAGFAAHQQGDGVTDSRVWFSEPEDMAGLSEDTANQLFTDQPYEQIWSGVEMGHVYIGVTTAPSYKIPDFEHPFEDFVAFRVSRLDGSFELNRRPAVRVEHNGEIAISSILGYGRPHADSDSRTWVEVLIRHTSSARGTCEARAQKF